MIACRPHKTPLRKLTALWLCSAISISYVAALYVIVPNSIQRLARDDPRQIRWRSLATVIVGVVSIAISTIISCEDGLLSIFRLSVATFIFEARATMSVLGHVMVLYSYPLVLSIIKISRMTPPNDGALTSLKALLKNYYTIIIGPFIYGIFRAEGNEQEHWVLLRNYILAPFTEEIVFRCSIILILKASALTDRLIVWTSPLFFGFAHIHHAFLKYSQGQPLLSIVLQTIFQFAYTTLFGSYASFVFLHTKSIGAIIVSHAFCNIMGLPDLSFFYHSSPYYSSRMLLGFSFGFGIVGFSIGLLYDLLPNANQDIMEKTNDF